MIKTLSPWFCALVLTTLWGAVAFAESPQLPELKSIHKDILADPDEYREEKPQKRKDIKGVGKDLERFGEEVAGRLDSIVSKKGFSMWGDPWTIQGIPLLFPSSTAGFNLGLNATLANIRREDPHQFEIRGQVLASDKGRYKHFFALDLPRLFDGKYRLTTRVAYNRDITFRYFGIGNDTKVDKDLADNNSPIFENVRNGPSFDVIFLKYFGQYFRVGPKIGLKWTAIEFPTGGLLDTQRPIGVDGGRTHTVGGAAIYDTLDFELDPTRGTYHEFFLNWSPRWFGSDYEFWRFTYTFRHYWPLTRRLVLAHRSLLEVIAGTAPFYEVGATGGTNSSIGFGGDRYLRGYEGNRYMDQIKGVLGFELRWDAFGFSWAKQDLRVMFVPFMDFGRVWDKLFPLDLGGLHLSSGMGMRLVWNRRYILRGDFAVNRDRSAFYVELGHGF